MKASKNNGPLSPVAKGTAKIAPFENLYCEESEKEGKSGSSKIGRLRKRRDDGQVARRNPMNSGSLGSASQIANLVICIENQAENMDGRNLGRAIKSAEER
jgi:hypothetical protein